MRADRDKRAAILTAEGQRQSAILTAEGQKQSAILSAEGARESQILRAQADREAAILRAQGEGQAIQTVFQAIHDGNPDQSLLAYQYLQMMPKIAEGGANKLWIVPSEIGKALEGLGSTMNELRGIPKEVEGPKTRVDMGSSEPSHLDSRTDSELTQANKAVEAAIAEAASAAQPLRPTAADPLSASPPQHRGWHPGAAHAVTLLEAAAILLAGLAAGLINTVVGSGTLITFPTLVALGVPPVTANVSNTVGLVPGSVSGAVGYRRELRGQRGRAVRLGSASLRRRAGRRAAPAGAAGGGVRGDRAGADPARPGAGGLPASDLGVGGAPARRGRWAPRERGLVGAAGGAAGRGVRRLLRRRAGRAADGDPGHRASTSRCSG